MPHYTALWTAPVMARNGQTGFDEGRPVKWHDILAWPAHGRIQARDEKEALRIAKERFGGSPVIEEVQEPIHYVGLS